MVFFDGRASLPQKTIIRQNFLLRIYLTVKSDFQGECETTSEAKFFQMKMILHDSSKQKFLACCRLQKLKMEKEVTTAEIVNKTNNVSALSQKRAKLYVGFSFALTPAPTKTQHFLSPPRQLAASNERGRSALLHKQENSKY